MNHSGWGWASAAIVGSLVLGSAEAAACGGTFCGGGPSAMPVDQKGENILFVDHGDGTLSAHVQIQYEGDADHFAWLVPLPTEPKISIGSQPLFDFLLQSSVPTYGFTRTGCSTVVALEGGGSIEQTETASGHATVLAREVVGAFEVAVLEADSASVILDWLGDNDYDQPPGAEDFLEPYLEEGMVFAAIKLTGGAGVDQIHPIVFRYRGDRASIPLRLTGIAATDDMFVRAFFLGEGRTLPSNFRHVELNPARLDWVNFAGNYLDVLSEAVDADAGGHGFVTEFAGPTPVAPVGALYRTTWTAESFVSLAPAQVIPMLRQFGLLDCRAASCNSAHPLILPMLEKYLPPPEDVDAQAFYSCIECYADYVAEVEWDGAAFAREFLERLVVPARDAQDLVDNSAYLTRLLTVLDADEMTVDPLFHQRDDLDDVSNQQFSAWDLACSNVPTTGMTLPNGMQVALAEDMTWPQFDDMPAALRVEDISESDDPDVLVDYEEDIIEQLEEWNDERDWPQSDEASESDADSSDDALLFGGDDPSLTSDSTNGDVLDDSSSESSETANDGTTPEEADPEDPAAAEGDRALASGGCRVGRPHSSTPQVGWVLMLLGWAYSRRRRPRW